MGLIRKAAIIGTGGAARVAINPNSKKARTAKATEQMLALQQAEAKKAAAAAEAAARAEAQAARAEFIEKHQGRTPEQMAYIASVAERATIEDPVERAAAVNGRLHASWQTLIDNLRGELLETEEVVALLLASDVVGTTRLKRNKGILVLTSDRVLFRTHKPKYNVSLARASVRDGSLKLSAFSAPSGPEMWITGEDGKVASRFMLLSPLNAWFEAFYFLHPDKREEDLVRVEPVDAVGSTDLLDQLAKLGALRDSGVLTDEEFAAQKAKLLA